MANLISEWIEEYDNTPPAPNYLRRQATAPSLERRDRKSREQIITLN
jgi:hypothetical protein